MCNKVYKLFKYMCNKCVYLTQILNLYNMCVAHVTATHVIHLYFYTCNTPKNTTHVIQV